MSGIKKINHCWLMTLSMYIMIAGLMLLPAGLLAQDSIHNGGMTENPVSFGTIAPGNARKLVLSGDISAAIGVYAQLYSRDSANISLNAEYAYALALGGIYDAALSRLDRIWVGKGENPETDFYASQVFALMGFTNLASELGTGKAKNAAPEWIAAKASEMVGRYKKASSSRYSNQTLVDETKMANALAARNYYLGSIALFEDITTQYPDEYLPFVGYSIVLEKAGLNGASASKLEAAIKILGDSPDELSTREVLEQRLTTVRKKAELQAKNPRATFASENTTPQLLLYAGGQLSSSFSSINGRFGYFMGKSSYASVDAGFTGISGTSSTNLGLSIYQRGRIMVAGLGMTASFSNGTTVLYSKVSMGPSIMNKNHTASWDIFFDGRTALSKGYTTTIGISIGRSVYFGKRR